MAYIPKIAIDNPDAKKFGNSEVTKPHPEGDDDIKFPQMNRGNQNEITEFNAFSSQRSHPSLKLNRLYNLKLPVFKFLGEQTNHSENEQIYHSNFIWYAETSSSGDINLLSYHLTAFELTYQLLYMNFLSLERKIFQKDLKLRCRRLLRDFVTSLILAEHTL